MTKAGAIAELLHAGLASAQAGRVDEAAATYEKVLRRDARNHDALHLLGLAEAQRGRLDRAIQLLRRATALYPSWPAALTNLGVLLNRRRRPEEALAVFDRALAIESGHAVALSNRGLALVALQRPDDALASFDRALAADPRYAEAHADRGLALRELQRPRDALASFLRAVALRPGLAAARFAAGQCHLLLGEFEQGWQEYEHRPASPDARLRGRPRWDGGPLHGRTLLLHAEQGMGDTVQFCRYAAMAAACGGPVLLEAPAPLLPVLRSLAGPTALIARGDALPAFDVHCPLMSLPLAFGTVADTIPAAPAYLSADPERIMQWSERLGSRSRPRVGLAWSGDGRHPNDHNRSLTFEELAPLLTADVDWVSLQREVRDADAGAFARSGVRHFGTALTDYGETAALIASLDMVVAVDTGVAHLAGALGKPTAVMLPWVAEWRWLQDHNDTPWYPSLRLVRQPTIRNWPAVLDRVRRMLPL